jgi:hypothetical protein
LTTARQHYNLRNGSISLEPPFSGPVLVFSRDEGRVTCAFNLSGRIQEVAVPSRAKHVAGRWSDNHNGLLEPYEFVWWDNCDLERRS